MVTRKSSRRLGKKHSYMKIESTLGEPGRKTLQKTRSNNELNPVMTPGSVFDHGSH